MIKKILMFFGAFSIISCLPAQEANYDESNVPDYVLPELLTNATRSEVKTARDWEKIRRPVVVDLFEQYVYGKVPEGDYRQSHEVLSHEQNALDGLA